MTSLARILKPVLADFAKELLAAGFKVYLPKSDLKRVANGGREQVGTWFQFSREVDGQTCHASVSVGYFDSATFNMPIRPSRENGSGMWLAKAEGRGQGWDRQEALTLANARLYASPSGSNPIVGTQKNYEDPRFSSMYEEVAG